MAVVVEPILTEDKLRSLLTEKHEQSCLDYKRSLNLALRRDIVELAKDVAAMQSESAGGYLVVGADDRGDLPQRVASGIDWARDDHAVAVVDSRGLRGSRVHRKATLRRSD